MSKNNRFVEMLQIFADAGYRVEAGAESGEACLKAYAPDGTWVKVIGPTPLDAALRLADGLGVDVSEHMANHH